MDYLIVFKQMYIKSLHPIKQKVGHTKYRARRTKPTIDGNFTIKTLIMIGCWALLPWLPLMANLPSMVSFMQLARIFHLISQKKNDRSCHFSWKLFYLSPAAPPPKKKKERRKVDPQAV